MFIYSSMINKPGENMSAKSELSVAYALSLTGGILIIIGSIIRVLVIPYFGIWGWGMIGGWHMMGAWTTTYNGIFWVFTFFSIIGLISGILVLIGAMKLQSNVTTWATIIIAFSVVSFIAGGGFIVGGILGLVGGILAITSK